MDEYWTRPHGFTFRLPTDADRKAKIEVQGVYPHRVVNNTIDIPYRICKYPGSGCATVEVGLSRADAGVICCSCPMFLGQCCDRAELECMSQTVLWYVAKNVLDAAEGELLLSGA